MPDPIEINSKQEETNMWQNHFARLVYLPFQPDKNEPPFVGGVTAQLERSEAKAAGVGGAMRRDRGAQRSQALETHLLMV